MLAVPGAGEVLADQPRHEQECVTGPVVGHGVLRLPAGVAGNEDDVADLLAADPSGVVLPPAVAPQIIEATPAEETTPRGLNGDAGPGPWPPSAQRCASVGPTRDRNVHPCCSPRS